MAARILSGWRHWLQMMISGMIAVALISHARAQSPAPTPPPSSIGPSEPATNSPPRWLTEVRAQRKALAEQRQQYFESLQFSHQAKRNAQSQRFEEQRRRVTGALAEQHRAYLGDDSPPTAPAPARPSGWDNPWYYRGW